MEILLIRKIKKKIMNEKLMNFDKIVKNKGVSENIYYADTKEHREGIKKILSKLTDDNPQNIILDAGCGICNFIIPLSANSKFIYGIDTSAESIKICKRRLKENNISNVDLEISSIIDLKFENNTMDKILCYSVFQYLNYDETIQTIKEFKRVLKNDGLLILGFLNGSSPYIVSARILMFIKKLIIGGRDKRPNNLKFKELKKIINAENGNIEIIHSSYFYPDIFPNKIANWIGKRFYYEKYFPKFIQKFGFSLILVIKFSDK